MKIYPLDVQQLFDIDGGGSVTYYSKGHHDLTKFAEIVKYEFEEDIDPLLVRHSYMRWEMYSGPDGPCQIGAEHRKVGRGIFPVTILT